MKKVKKPTWVGSGLDEVGGVVRGLAERNLPCLVVGPTGTGKELLTQLYAFVWQTQWKKCRYHRLNCTGFVEGLLTSHLFGYEAGSFTGAAKAGKKGLVAANDLICLDELGDASETFQAHVLRVVEYGTFTRVGGTNEEHTECRFIGSTSRLEKIRSDLAYRFHVVHIPPLALRPHDLAALVIHFGQEAGVREFTERFAAWSARYLWPGNVRELRRRIEAAALTSARVLDLPNSEEFSCNATLYRSCQEPGVKSASAERRPLTKFEEAYDAHYSEAAVRSLLGGEQWRSIEERQASPIADAIDRLSKMLQLNYLQDQAMGMPRKKVSASADAEPRPAPGSRRNEIEAALRKHKSRAGAALELGIPAGRLRREIYAMKIDAGTVIAEAGGLQRRRRKTHDNDQ